MNTAVIPSILLVEDDLRLAELVSHYLQSNGLRVAVAARGDDALAQVRRDPPDLIILDLGLPDQDGLSLCGELRREYTIPILILTARSSDFDQVLGLEFGADDYVIKPVEPRVLLARIKALRRRHSQPAVQCKTLQFGALRINTTARAVTLDGQPVPLSNHEFELLLFLAIHAGEIQSREALFQHLYKREYDGIDRLLDVRVSHLRRKLGDDAERSERIKTVWGQGYLFVPDAW
jgi:DNA-binding response OmpR family regulator